MILRVLFALLLLIVGAGAATLLWRYQSPSCEEIKSKIVEVYRAIPKDRKRTKEESAKVSAVLDEACSPTYKMCSFKACESRLAQLNVTDPPKEVSGESLPAKASPQPTTTLPEKPSQNDKLSQKEKHPLAWLEETLPCDEFLRRVKSRYATVPKFAQLPPDKQQELKTILAVACSKRYAHCKFPSCQK